jgi:hypothetical protein
MDFSGENPLPMTQCQEYIHNGPFFSSTTELEAKMMISYITLI